MRWLRWFKRNAPEPAPPQATDSEPLEKLSFTGWLAEWAEQHPIEGTPPLPEAARQQLLAERGLHHLPQDYRELLAQCDGCLGSDYTVLGVEGMYDVSLNDVVYWILAERGGGFIVAPEGDSEARVYFIHHEEETPSHAFGSFQAALAYMLSRRDLP